MVAPGEPQTPLTGPLCTSTSLAYHACIAAGRTSWQNRQRAGSCAVLNCCGMQTDCLHGEQSRNLQPDWSTRSTERVWGGPKEARRRFQHCVFKLPQSFWPHSKQHLAHCMQNHTCSQPHTDPYDMQIHVWAHVGIETSPKLLLCARLSYLVQAWADNQVTLKASSTCAA